jgi:hypothetical protein
MTIGPTTPANGNAVDTLITLTQEAADLGVQSVRQSARCPAGTR